MSVSFTKFVHGTWSASKNMKLSNLRADITADSRLVGLNSPANGSYSEAKLRYAKTTRIVRIDSEKNLWAFCFSFLSHCFSWLNIKRKWSAQEKYNGLTKSKLRIHAKDAGKQILRRSTAKIMRQLTKTSGCGGEGSIDLGTHSSLEITTKQTFINEYFGVKSTVNAAGHTTGIR